MPNLFKVKALLVCILSIISLSALANHSSNNITNYIKNNFGTKLRISQAQIKQLSWIEGHKKRSFDQDIYVADPKMHIEIVRALTRLYCLQLLKSGSQQDYNNFIAAQLQSNANKPLTYSSFKKLSRHIQALNSADHELLETATILSAVSLSEPAYKLAQGIVNLDNSANDNLGFLTTTVRIDNDIYPLIKQMSVDHQMAKKMLYILFPPQTNFRHMLYTEGGSSMFKYLRSMIKHQYLTQTDMDLWYAHWIVNIAGFRGHVANAGSLYLTEPVFQAMNKLHSLTNNMLQTPNFDPLLPYLEYRADLLGFNNLPEQERIFLAHLAAMMRIYDPVHGTELQSGFAKLDPTLRQALQKEYYSLLHDYQGNTPTYLPALLCNTMAHLDNNIATTLHLVMPVYYAASCKYAIARKENSIAGNVVLSFNQLSAKANIMQLVKLGNKSADYICVSNSGEVIVSNKEIL